MSIAYYESNKIADYEFGLTAHTPSANLYIGLSTTAINANGSGATEPAAGSYARVTVANNKTTWSTAASGSLSNAIQISFPESSASWGTITHVFIADAASAGNVLYYQALSTSRAVPTQTTVYFAIGGFVVTLT